VSLVKGNLKGLQAKSSPECNVNQRWRQCWVTRRKTGEACAESTPCRKTCKGKRPTGLIDVIRVRMDGTECVDDRGKHCRLLDTNVYKVDEV
jgi:hypothetical protein